MIEYFHYLVLLLCIVYGGLILLGHTSLVFLRLCSKVFGCWYPWHIIISVKDGPPFYTADLMQKIGCWDIGNSNPIRPVDCYEMYLMKLSEEGRRRFLHPENWKKVDKIVKSYTHSPEMKEMMRLEDLQAYEMYKEGVDPKHELVCMFITKCHHCSRPERVYAVGIGMLRCYYCHAEWVPLDMNAWMFSPRIIVFHNEAPVYENHGSQPVPKEEQYFPIYFQQQ